MNFKLKPIQVFHTWGGYQNGFFNNVVPYGDGYVGACRAGAASLGDKVHIVTYDNSFNLLSNEYVTGGEDPRTFLYKGKPHAVTWDPYNYEQDCADPNQIHYKLINLVDKKVTHLKVEGTKPSNLAVLGKNWMPLVQGDDLYIVISIEPVLNIVKVDLASGDCVWTETSNFEGYIPVTQNRGGTPFLFVESLDCFVGVGHKTYNSYKHTPYVYTLSKDMSEIRVYDEILTGYDLVEDPHSIFAKDGIVYCCINNWDLGKSNDGTSIVYELTFEK